MIQISGPSPPAISRKRPEIRAFSRNCLEKKALPRLDGEGRVIRTLGPVLASKPDRKIALRRKTGWSCLINSDGPNLRSGLVGVSAENCPKFASFRELFQEKMQYQDSMAEGEGFEPPVTFRLQRFSRPPVSTAHASLRGGWPVTSV